MQLKDYSALEMKSIQGPWPISTNTILGVPYSKYSIASYAPQPYSKYRGSLHQASLCEFLNPKP